MGSVSTESINADLIAAIDAKAFSERIAQLQTAKKAFDESAAKNNQARAQLESESAKVTAAAQKRAAEITAAAQREADKILSEAKATHAAVIADCNAMRHAAEQELHKANNARAVLEKTGENFLHKLAHVLK